MNAITLAEKEGRLTFYNGRMRYTPTKSTQQKMIDAKKPFDSIKAHLNHSKKLIFRDSIREGLRKIELIENQLIKGKKIIRITNKNYICE